MLIRVWLFTFAVIAVVALFGPHQEPTRPWMHGRVAEVLDEHTFGFLPDGKNFWLTVRVEEGQGLEIGQRVEVRPIGFEKDGAMRARVQREANLNIFSISIDSYPIHPLAWPLTHTTQLRVAALPFQDKTQLEKTYTTATILRNEGISGYIDSTYVIAHNRKMDFDGRPWSQARSTSGR